MESPSYIICQYYAHVLIHTMEFLLEMRERERERERERALTRDDGEEEEVVRK